jgi:aspartate dehydrogenase
VTRYAWAEDEPVAAILDDPNVLFTSDVEAFFALEPDVVVEVAGQEAVRQYAARVLGAGSDLLVASIGAFTDDAFYGELQDLAIAGPGRLMLAGGALPAVDWMQAAAMLPVTEVTITQTKPVGSWQGTPAEDLVALDALAEPVTFFEGTARRAAATFVKSSNITAMLALATVGLDATRVRLIADPARQHMHTRIDFDGDAGVVHVEWEGVPSATNPSTSADVPLAIVKAIRNLTADVVLGM